MCCCRATFFSTTFSLPLPIALKKPFSVIFLEVYGLSLAEETVFFLLSHLCCRELETGKKQCHSSRSIYILFQIHPSYICKSSHDFKFTHAHLLKSSADFNCTLQHWDRISVIHTANAVQRSGNKSDNLFILPIWCRMHCIIICCIYMWLGTFEYSVWNAFSSVMLFSPWWNPICTSHWDYITKRRTQVDTLFTNALLSNWCEW